MHASAPGASARSPTPPAEPAAGSDSPAAPASPRGDATQNYAMRLAYDGSAFQGWQVQPRGPSVQGAIEAALRTITRHETKVYGSGRTDSGVHALGQVANFRIPPGPDPHQLHSSLDGLHKLRSNLNGLLKPHVSVMAIVPVSADFHARHKARGKLYRYRLHDRPYPPAFGLHRTWWIKLPLDVEAMRAAAARLLGEHDFSAFRSRHCAAARPVRTLHRLDVVPRDEPDCSLSLELEASGFLQHMARILAGTLVDVGLGRLAPEAVGAILASRQRERAGTTAPSGGLHLVRVDYDLETYPELRALEQR